MWTHEMFSSNDRNPHLTYLFLEDKIMSGIDMPQVGFLISFIYHFSSLSSHFTEGRKKRTLSLSVFIVSDQSYQLRFNFFLKFFMPCKSFFPQDFHFMSLPLILAYIWNGFVISLSFFYFYFVRLISEFMLIGQYTMFLFLTPHHDP